MLRNNGDYEVFEKYFDNFINNNFKLKPCKRLGSSEIGLYCVLLYHLVETEGKGKIIRHDTLMINAGMSKHSYQKLLKSLRKLRKHGYIKWIKTESGLCKYYLEED